MDYKDIQYYSTFGKTFNCMYPDGISVYGTHRFETTNLISQNYLKEIIFNQGKVVFETSGNRKDRNKNGLILNAIKIYAGSELRKWITFKHDYFYSDIGNTYFNPALEASKYRLKLESLVEKDVNGTDIKKYQFEYNQELLPPYGNFGVDIWGYYNGYANNETLAYWENCQYGIDQNIYILV